MCIFSRPIDKVGQTRIFAATLTGGRQVIVYANSVASSAQKNAMILPFPTGPCAMFDTTGMKGPGSSIPFFDRLHDMFHPKTRSPEPAQALRVDRVGDFLCSYADSIADLERVDASVMIVEPDTLEFIKRSYPTGFGFLICKLAEGVTNEHAYSPIGYVCNRLPTASGGSLFVPTMHEHGSASSGSAAGGGPAAGPVLGEGAEPEWDHDIYVVGVSVEPGMKYFYVPKSRAERNAVKMCPEYKTAEDRGGWWDNTLFHIFVMLPEEVFDQRDRRPVSRAIHYMRRLGRFPNGDLILEVDP